MPSLSRLVFWISPFAWINAKISTRVEGEMASEIAAPFGKKTLQADFITLLNHNDVLCGRGSGPNDNIGNINFRQIVLSRKAEYSTSTRLIKTHIAEEIFSFVQNKEPRGRFLKKVDAGVLQDSGFNPGAKVWCLVVHDVALEKVKQALRQKGDKHLVGYEVRHKQQERQSQEQRKRTHHQDVYRNRKKSDRSGEIVYASGYSPPLVRTGYQHHIMKREEKFNDMISHILQSQEYNHRHNWQHQATPFRFW